MSSHKPHCASLFSFRDCDCGASQTEVDIHIQLLNANKEKADVAKCGHSIKCTGIACSKCPLKNGEQMLGDLRATDPRNATEPTVEQAEAPKGAGVQESTQRITDAVELLKQAAPVMLADNGGPDGPLVGRLKSPSADDDVKSPSHYQLFEGLESIEVIARSMTVEMFKGFCLGNVLKYRLRAGKKSELATLEKDMAKATFYLELYTKHKAQCYDAE